VPLSVDVHNFRCSREVAFGQRNAALIVNWLDSKMYVVMG